MFELDPDYGYAYVSGFNTDYLWLLAREPVISEQVKKDFVARALELGFATEKLIWSR